MIRLLTDVPAVRAIAGIAGALCLRLLGWRIKGSPPERQSYIVVVAPHTSRWDAIIVSSALAAQRVPAYWLGKDSLFRGPCAAILRAFGGIPVDRAHGAQALAQAEHLLNHVPRPIVIFPEGTRACQTQWKSGFYHLAMATGTPAVPVALDFVRKQVRWGTALHLSGDPAKDMECFRHFFSDTPGRNPEDASPVCISEEDSSSTPGNGKSSPG